LAPGGGGQPNPNLQFMTSSYRAMSGLQVPLNQPGATNTFSGFWNEVQAAAQFFPRGRGPFHGDGKSGLKPERLVNITDGASNTLFVGERAMLNHFSRGPFWADSFNLYSMGGAFTGTGAGFALLPDYDYCA